MTPHLFAIAGIARGGECLRRCMVMDRRQLSLVLLSNHDHTP